MPNDLRERVLAELRKGVAGPYLSPHAAARKLGRALIAVVEDTEETAVERGITERRVLKIIAKELGLAE